jgi:hypothetical protein
LRKTGLAVLIFRRNFGFWGGKEGFRRIRFDWRKTKGAADPGRASRTPRDRAAPGMTKPAEKDGLAWIKA